MLCQECGKKMATVHVTKIVNNQKTERHLCEDCAGLEQEINFDLTPVFSVQQFLANLLNYEQQGKHTYGKVENSQARCPNCGFSYDDFVNEGRLGCSHCYDVFKPQIDNLLKRIHGSVKHGGKLPKRMGGKYRAQRDLQKLRQQLEENVRLEKFEVAAELRDQIKALEKEIQE